MRKKIFLGALLLFTALVIHAQCGSNDPFFNPGSGANNYLRTISIQSDGKIIIGGFFTSYDGIARNHIARLNVDGSLDDTFNPGTGANGIVNATVIQSDGKIIIAGSFSSYNGTTRNRVARLNTDGSLDDTFNQGTGADSEVAAMAIQNDDKVIIVGFFTSYDGVYRIFVARLNTDGGLDTTFVPGIDYDINPFATVIQSDGKILIGGNNGSAINRITRLNTDGSLDASFNPGTGTDHHVMAISIQSDNKIIIGGAFTNYNGTNINRIARLNTDGSIDDSFNPGTGPDHIVYSLATQSDGKIIVGGVFDNYNGTARNSIARLNSDGSLDEGFNSGTGESFDYVWTTAIQSDGKIIIGGRFTSYNGKDRNRIARIIACDDYFYHNDTIAICEGETYSWHGTDYTTAGVYYDNLTTIYGCDSIYQLTLLVNPIYSFKENCNICDGETYTWRGDDYSSTGIYYDSLTTMNGCDSINQLTLQVNPVYTYTENHSICNGEIYTWHGTDYTSAGVYYDNLTTINGCDSIYQLTLQVNPAYTYTENHIICNGETYTWRGTDYSSTGIYYDSFTTINGCDSVYQLILQVNPVYTYSENHSICDGETYTWGGTDYSSTGIYYDSFTTINGCDSIYQLTLQVNPVYTYSENHSICDGETYTWHGKDFTTAGVYYDNLTTINGCDSVYQLTLQVNPAYTYAENHIICEGETYSWHGTDYSSAGIYYDSLTTINGSDSVYQLTLHVNPIYTYTESHSICDGETFIWHGADYTSAGVYYDSLTSINGCDSIYQIVLTVNSIDTGVIISGETLTANLGADSYQWIDCNQNFAPINGEVYQSYTAKTNGNYAVIITSGLCTDTSLCTQILINSIASTKIEGDISIYPIPFSNELVIEVEGNNGDINFEISNEIGQLVYTGIVVDEALIQTSHFAPGIYIIKLENVKSFEYKKIIKN